MNELNELNNYVCQFCKKEYQSDGSKKPKLFKKDGSVHQYYDSTLFCSKECCLKQWREKVKQTFKNNPEILKKSREKRKQTLLNNPEIMKRVSESLRQTYKCHPEIIEQQKEARKQTYENNPEIRIKQTERRRQTLLNNPEIMEQAGIRRSQTLKNNPEIMKKARLKQKQTYKNNTEIVKKSREKYKQTLLSSPEITERRVEKFKLALLNNPEIMKQAGRKRSRIFKNNPEIMKQREVKRLSFYKNHPEIKEQATLKFKETLKNHPEVVEQSILKRKTTLRNNPEIMKNIRIKRLETLKNHPEIIKQISETLKQTLKNNSEIMKKSHEKLKQTKLQQFKEQHSNYFELFKSYEDVLDYIKNNNIKTRRELSMKLNIDSCVLMSHLSQDFNLDERFDKLLDGSISFYEKELCSFLDQLNIKYQLHNRTLIKPYEIDIYIPDHKIGIEFNSDFYHGEYFYWGNELKPNKEPNYHQIKSRLAEEKGIFLFHIFEYEYVQKREVFLSMIRNLLNKNENKIPARKCEIKEIDSKTTNEFLSNNHLQGSDSSSIRYGLFNKDQLVSVMTFCKPRFNKRYDYELSRFCSLRNHTVIGGANKLFKYFVRQNSNKSVISYSNIAHTKGNVYKKLEFSLQSASSPNYVWFKYKRTEENRNLKDLYKRYEVQKHKLVQQRLDKYGRTENEIMTNLGYYRIFDCGNKVWLYDEFPEYEV